MGAAFDLAEYMLLALTTRSHYPLACAHPTRFAALSDCPSLSLSLFLSLSFSLSLSSLRTPVRHGLASPHFVSPRRARPLINGPAHFAGMNGAKNYALLNTDELRNQRRSVPDSSCLVPR